MKHLIAICVLCIAGPAVADQSWRVSLGGGMHHVNDDAVEAISASRLMVDTQLGLDYAVFGDLWIGVAAVSSWISGDTYERFETDLDGSGVRFNVQYRHRLLPWMDTFARVGVDAMWFSASINETYGYGSAPQHLEDEDFAAGLSAAVGTDFYVPLVGGRGRSGREVGLGFTFELSYVRLAELEFSDQNTHLGAIDPSGIGVNTGVAVLF